MAEGRTFMLSRVELRRMLVASGVTERDIAAIVSQIEKAHMHVNVISFAALLEKSGMNNERITNIFRRLGMGDIEIRKVMDMIDSYKINAETGRLYDVTLDTG